MKKVIFFGVAGIMVVSYFLFGSTDLLLQGRFNLPTPFKLQPSQLKNIENSKVKIDNRIQQNIVQCSSNEYSMGFVLLVRNLNEATAERIASVNRIKAAFSDLFWDATDHLATMDTSRDVHTMIVSNDMFDQIGNLDITAVTRAFYQANSNASYNFLTFYNTFQPDNGSPQKHSLVKNNIRGIGFEIIDYSNSFGSHPALLGVNNMNNIDGYRVIEDLGARGILHETAHQWCCKAGDPFSNGANNARLEIREATEHYYRGLSAPNRGGDPLRADFWQRNNNGTYNNVNDANEEYKLHPFTLYFMGLLPQERYDEIYTLYNAGLDGMTLNNVIPYKKVSVRDIIATEGPRSCQN